MCDGNCYKGLTQQRKRGKTDDQQFPALQKGNSDRSSKKTSTKRDKVTEQVNSVDGLDDLTLSPETASEDCESLYPNCKNILRLIERLGLESKDSVRLFKIQNAVHSFRRLIEHKEADYELLRGRLKNMENKVNRLQKELLETRETNSQLEHQNVAWEQEICNVRFTLKQETKKNAYILYEKIKEDLKRKEKQYNEQVYRKQQLESTVRALEFELKSIKNKPNQVLEE
ncbi:ankyrin repeat domain-containing protein 26-like isoform X2 [Camelus dromedarius]